MNPFWRKEVLESRIVSNFSPLGNLRSHFTTRSVSYFLLFLIYSHFRKLGVIFFSPFSDLQSLWKPGSVSFFLFLAICGHFRIHECICILLFCNLRSLFTTRSVSYFLLFLICSHILTPEMYLHFSFLRFAVTYRRQKAMSKAWWVTKKRNKRRFSRLMLRFFLDSKKDSGISCLFWRRYFFLWGVAKTI